MRNQESVRIHGRGQLQKTLNDLERSAGDERVTSENSIVLAMPCIHERTNMRKKYTVKKHR